MRRRWRWIPLLFLLGLGVEIAAFVLLANQVGFAWSMLVLFAMTVLGAWLVRRELPRTMRALRTVREEGRPPGREVVDSVLVVLGALLILFPGFLSDLVGLLLLLPPTRALIRPLALGRLAARLTPDVANVFLGPRQVRARRGRPTADPTGEVIEGEVVNDER